MADKKISALTGATTPLAGTEVLPIVQSGATVKVSVDDLTVKNVRSNATTGILQIAGPAAASTRTMTVPDANFTAARTDVAQTFTGDNVFGDTSFTGFVKVVAGKGLAYTANTAVYMTPEDNIQGARIAAGGSFKLLVGGGSEAINVDGTSKDVKATAGNLVIGTAGKGIDFSANGGDVLTQYDEGTWTPVVTASAGSITSYTSSGRYTRVGREVTAVFTFKLTNAGTASGAIIATLPFSGDGAITYVGCGRDDNLGSMVQGRVLTSVPGSVYILTYANASVALTNTEVFFSIQYFV